MNRGLTATCEQCLHVHVCCATHNINSGMRKETTQFVKSVLAMTASSLIQLHRSEPIPVARALVDGVWRFPSLFHLTQRIPKHESNHISMILLHSKLMQTWVNTALHETLHASVCVCVWEINDNLPSINVSMRKLLLLVANYQSMCWAWNSETLHMQCAPGAICLRVQSTCSSPQGARLQRW